MIIGFIRALRSDERFADSMIVTIIEAQLSYLGSQSISELASAAAREFSRSDPPDANMFHYSPFYPDIRVGVPTRITEKLFMVNSTSRRLEARKLGFVRNPVYFGTGRVEDSVKELDEQLRRYVIERKDPPNPAFGETKYSATTLSGNDDLCMALQIGLFWIPETTKDPTLRQIYLNHAPFWNIEREFSIQ